jgi:putative transposase
MARGKRYQPEQVVNLLRQIEVALANGKTTAQACKRRSWSRRTSAGGRSTGGVQVDQAKRLKELEQENAKLKQTHQWAAVNSSDDDPAPLLCPEVDAPLLTALAKPL